DGGHHRRMPCRAFLDAVSLAGARDCGSADDGRLRHSRPFLQTNRAKLRRLHLMRPIIHIENVGKRYQLASERAAYATLREALVGSFTKSVNRLRGRGETNADRAFWALRGIDLDVVPGERL